MAVPTVSISPVLVASRSPWNCLSIVILPNGDPSAGVSPACGVSLTSNGPVARVVTIGSAVVDGEAGTEGTASQDVVV